MQQKHIRILDIPGLRARDESTKSPEGDAMYKHILVPTDGSTLSLKAAKSRVTLARRLKARSRRST